MTLIIGRYARISTAENKKALERINYTLEQAVAKLGGDITKSPLWCEVMSGTRRDRPEFIKMRAEVEARRLDVLVTYRVDRLARDAGYGIDFGRLLERTGVRLFDCHKDGFIDFSNPDEWERYASQSVQAEAESRKLSTRIRAGKAYGRHTGQAGGKPPWGYIRNPETGKYELDPTLINAATESVLSILVDGNFSRVSDEIAGRFGKRWHNNGLRNWVTNPVLRGHTGYQKNGRNWGEIKYNTHTDHAILTEAQYQQIEEKLKSNSVYWGKNKQCKRHELAGLVRCARCGSRMVVLNATRSNGPGAFYFACQERTKNIKLEVPCSFKRSLPKSIVEEVVVDCLTKASTQIAELALEPEDAPKPPRLMELEKLLATLENLGNNPALESSKAQIKIEISQLTHTQSKNTTSENRELMESVFSDPVVWRTLKDSEKRQVFQSLIDKIVVDYEEVEIGLSTRGNPKLRLDFVLTVHFSNALLLPPMTVLIPFFPRSSHHK